MLKRLWARGNLEVESRTKTSNQYWVIGAAYSTVVSSWPWGAQVADQKIIILCPEIKTECESRIFI